LFVPFSFRFTNWLKNGKYQDNFFFGFTEIDFLAILFLLFTGKARGSTIFYEKKIVFYQPEGAQEKFFKKI